MSGKPLTGRKVFAIIASAFAVIIGVNLYMASMAIGTFPGLETQNGYIASQQFDTDRAAQLALGWDVSARIEGKQLRLTILGPDGAPVQPATLTATLGRTTIRTQDRTPDFVFDGTALVAPVDLEPGKWDLRMLATAANGTKFRQSIIMVVDAAS